MERLVQAKRGTAVAAFLRLKFYKLDEAEKLLNEAGIAFSPSPLAKREKYYSLLHESVLDEKGRPKEALRRKARRH